MGARIRFEFGDLAKCKPWKTAKIRVEMGCRSGLIRGPDGSVPALCLSSKTAPGLVREWGFRFALQTPVAALLYPLRPDFLGVGKTAFGRGSQLRQISRMQVGLWQTGLILD